MCLPEIPLLPSRWIIPTTRKSIPVNNLCLKQQRSYDTIARACRQELDLRDQQTVDFNFNSFLTLSVSVSVSLSLVLLLLYVHVCVTRTGWKTRPRPKTVILSINQSIKQSLFLCEHAPTHPPTHPEISEWLCDSVGPA